MLFAITSNLAVRMVVWRALLAGGYCYRCVIAILCRYAFYRHQREMATFMAVSARLS